MEDISAKIEAIKTKIQELASKIENLRSENLMLIEENKKLKINLQRDADEIQVLKHQIASLECMNVPLTEKLVEQEESEV